MNTFLSLINNYQLQSAITIPTPSFGGSGLPSTIGGLVTNILGVISPIAVILFVVLIIYGGFSYMMAMGDPGKVKMAQSIIVNSVIGLIIVALAFVIQAIVMSAFS